MKDMQENSDEKEESLPLFFWAESEARLRRGLEYETKEELWKILREIFTESRVLGNAWRKSTEWEEIDVYKRQVLNMDLKEKAQDGYYVYAKGGLADIFSTPAQAIRAADDMMGVVLRCV